MDRGVLKLLKIDRVTEGRSGRDIFQSDRAGARRAHQGHGVGGTVRGGVHGAAGRHELHRRMILQARYGLAHRGHGLAKDHVIGI
jgi:hypothetical protein